MPSPLYSQPTIAFVWDFEHALTETPMLAPVLAAYGIDAARFAEEVSGLVGFHAARGESLDSDLARLVHLLDHVQGGAMKGLTNDRLRRLGAELVAVPGVPDVLAETRELVRNVPEFAREGIAVEHYAVTTGPLAMVEGGAVAAHLDGMWGSTFLGERATPGYLDQLPVVAAKPQPITHIGVGFGHTAATRTIIEISKGANVDQTVQVDARIGADQHRVPFPNILFVSGSAGWVPAQSILNAGGGKTLGVFTDPDAERAALQLRDEGRVHAVAAADYRSGEAAHTWLIESLEQVAYGIVENRRQALAGNPDAPRPA